MDISESVSPHADGSRTVFLTASTDEGEESHFGSFVIAPYGNGVDPISRANYRALCSKLYDVLTAPGEIDISSAPVFKREVYAPNIADVCYQMTVESILGEPNSVP
tara:strand:+ start:71 stop:388 length:318 start_codon:yes stop_codon:yes gene_type:complete